MFFTAILHLENLYMTKIIIDSALSNEEILRQNPRHPCPGEVLKELVVINVEYFSFDGHIHSGQIAIHQDLAEDVKGAFKLLLQDYFPLESVVPISDIKYRWDDGVSTAANNSSAFNYRYVRNTTELSNHSTGRAIDINPRLNPYFLGNEVFPPHTTYDPAIPGTILAKSRLVTYFESLGWRWGGNWDEDLDFHHFEKLE